MLRGRARSAAWGSPDTLYARYSAHAEPWAALLALTQVVKENGACGKAQIRRAALVAAQRTENGYRGVGRGRSLNSLYDFPIDLLRDYDIHVVLFVIQPSLNPAHSLSRNFGAEVDQLRFHSVATEGLRIPSLSCLACPSCAKELEEEARFGAMGPSPLHRT